MVGSLLRMAGRADSTRARLTYAVRSRGPTSSLAATPPGQALLHHIPKGEPGRGRERFRKARRSSSEARNRQQRSRIRSMSTGTAAGERIPVPAVSVGEEVVRIAGPAEIRGEHVYSDPTADRQDYGRRDPVGHVFGGGSVSDAWARMPTASPPWVKNGSMNGAVGCWDRVAGPGSCIREACCEVRR